MRNIIALTMIGCRKIQSIQIHRAGYFNPSHFNFICSKSATIDINHFVLLLFFRVHASS